MKTTAQIQAQLRVLEDYLDAGISSDDRAHLLSMRQALRWAIGEDVTSPAKDCRRMTGTTPQQAPGGNHERRRDRASDPPGALSPWPVDSTRRLG